ncbi:short-chain dehydrogenase [Aspergillus pseudoustus]|uniref:Short-chain dehydrogenase n=1 Tax=Aspergillus pseudoustus TaxID=1810923 RepID=A0ABR4IB49_9EURO
MSILITGGTAGLGYHCSLALARQYPNHRIVIASRSNTNTPSDKINKTLGQTNVEYLRLNLGSLAEVRAFAKTWAEKNYPPIEYLLLNAGLQFPGPLGHTVDGFEQTFGVNHVGHALLFSLLVPHLAHTAHIVITASGTHDPAQKTGMPDAIYSTAEELAHPTGQSLNYAGRQRYTSSKLANILWAYALETRFKELRERKVRDWTVAAFDPGLIPGTGLVRQGSSIELFVWQRVLPKILPLLRLLVSPNIHTPAESGGNLAWLAASDQVKGTSGDYYEGRKKIKSSGVSYQKDKQEDLWMWTVKNIATSPDEIAQFSLKQLS